MGTLRIRRPFQLLAPFEWFAFHVDGKFVSNIRPSTTEEILVPPGRHVLQAKGLLLGYSQPLVISVAEGEVVDIEVGKDCSFARQFLVPCWLVPSGYLYLRPDYPEVLPA